MATTPRRLGASIPRPLHSPADSGDGAQITVIEYDANDMRARQVASIADWQPPEDASVAWIDIDDVRDPQVITRVGERFGIHPLVIEDIHNLHQRPKLDDYDDYLFIVLKMLTWDEKELRIHTERSA